MTQAALSRPSPNGAFKSGRFNLQNTFPFLRTLIDMLLVTGGLISAFIPMMQLFTIPDSWAFTVSLLGCWITFAASTALIFLTARSNRFKYRQTACACVAINMLFFAGLTIFACYALPNSDVVVAINPITIGVATWGVIVAA